nr:YdcF family protein [Propylenella binzhouense]
MPSNAIAIAIALGLLLCFLGRRRAGLGLALAGTAALFACGLGPVGNLLILPLEERFPQPQLAESPDGIVVLGGAITDVVGGLRGGTLELNEAGDRILALIALAHRFPEAKIVFSGGSGALIDRAPVPEADLLAARKDELGLGDRAILIENRSRNTAQNALYSRAIAEPRPGETWLLVTSAYHMPRAVGAFRAAGFPVVAYPVDYRTGGPSDVFRPFARIGEGLQRTDIAFREWVGLAAYRATGRTDRLLPGP